MTNQAISQLTAGTPPYAAGTLLELSVPAGGGLYSTVSGQYSDLVPATQLEQLTIDWDSNTPVVTGTFYALGASQWTTATVLGAVTQCSGGSFTATVNINGTGVSGLTNITVNTSQGTPTATGGTLSKGSSITVVVSAITGSPTNAYIQINLSKSAN